jgi:general secretion pathway protein K
LNQKLKQQGTAIVVALFVVALVAAAAVAMLTRSQQDMRRAELILNSTNAYFYAQGSIAWAMDQLINNAKQPSQQVTDKTPIKSPANKVDNATIESTIYDAQGFFNVNNLADPNYREVFSRLLKTVMPNISTQDTQAITLATISWITNNAAQASLDEYYAKLTPPYRSSHHLMTSVSELRLVKGMTAELFNQLYPYIIALPTTTAININNAAPPVLMSLSPTLNKDSAISIAKYCQQNPFPTTQNFLAFDIVKNNTFPAGQITTKSTYFLIKTQVTIGDQNTILYTLVQRGMKDSQPNVTILWQSKGTL